MSPATGKIATAEVTGVLRTSYPEDLLLDCVKIGAFDKRTRIYRGRTNGGRDR